MVHHPRDIFPLFANEVPGFSVEEHVSPYYWWTGDPEQDPWQWREIIPATDEVAYGKFFNNKTGFISKEWFPYFVNARRNGYDFDAAWEDGLMQRRYKAIMDICEDGGMHPGFELKPEAGFKKDGYKNFDGCMTALQMLTYLIILQSSRARCARSLRTRCARDTTKSPSCGLKQRYDGTFSGKLVEGPGVTAELLIRNGFHCIDVEDL